MRPQKPLKKDQNISSQRKTTLKWTKDGELTPIDMTRILERLSNPELTECELNSKELK